MAETAPTVHIGENSPELIAYKLLVTIAANVFMQVPAAR
jgi:hypothetical protein